MRRGVQGALSGLFVVVVVVVVDDDDDGVGDVVDTLVGGVLPSVVVGCGWGMWCTFLSG